jgi:Glyoxalase-like domain
VHRTQQMTGYAQVMFVGIDHLVIAVCDPDAAVDALAAALGLDPGDGGRHDRLGTRNRLIWLGDSYLELIGVFDSDLARDSWVGRPTLGVLASDRGTGLATWAIASDAIDADVAQLASAGSDIGSPQSGERRRPDGSVVSWRLAAAGSLGASDPPFLIEHDRTSAEWTAEDRAARAAQPANLVVLELAVDDVAGMTGRFLRTLGIRFRPSLVGRGARDADIGPQVVRFRPLGRGMEASTTVRIAHPGAPDAQTDLFGCRWIVGPNAASS